MFLCPNAPFLHPIYWLLLYLLPGCYKTDRCVGWGANAHRKITKEAVALLPPPLQNYYAKDLEKLVNASLAPDKRRYLVLEEAPYHYINLEAYNQRSVVDWENFWHHATAAEHTHYGALPWRLLKQADRLVWAMKSGNNDQIIRLSGDIAHYAADLHVVLHTTTYYDGYTPDQKGVHRFWETTLPNYFSSSYRLETPALNEHTDLYQLVWQAVDQTHQQTSKLYAALALAKASCPAWKQYRWRVVQNRWERLPSHLYAKLFHEALDGMVEQQMARAIYCVAQIFYSCWVAAGKPPLKHL